MSSNFYPAALLQKTVVNSPILSSAEIVTEPGTSNPQCAVCNDPNYCYGAAFNSSDSPSNCSYTNINGCDTGNTNASNCYYNGTMEDWHFSGEKGCGINVFGGNTPQCSTVDTTLCIIEDENNQYIQPSNTTYSTPCSSVLTPCTSGGPMTGEYVTTSWFSSNETYNDISQGRNIRCDFLASLFNENLPMIQAYYNRYVSSLSTIVAEMEQTILSFNSASYNLMMQDFSSTISTDPGATCPEYLVYPYQGVQPTTCSKFVASGDQGDWTRQWAGGSQGSFNTVPYSDNAKTQYCVNNVSAPECACINRAVVDNNYTNLQNIIDLPAQCWYVPCQSQAQYLITSDIADLSVCPQNICQIVNQNIAASGSTITSTQQQTLSCTVTNNPPPTPPDDGGSSGLPTWFWIVIAIIGFILIVGIIIIIIASSRKKK